MYPAESSATAASFVPSREEAIEIQFLNPAPVCSVHEAPLSDEV
ncbi:MAG: hypothetical protein RIS36_672 [Pseudomonadota bacterium]|jgi:hypothetical protein